MPFHEKSLELNITRELLNLSDSWYWFLMDLPLFRYWRPRYRLPFITPPAFAYGLHTNVEGKDDPSGEAGGGHDVRINSGGHLLFVQYKKGTFEDLSTNAKSIFHIPPKEHYKFEINSTKTNQHLTLRNLSNGAGKNRGNAVVYAFPLIRDMEELSRHAGRLLSRTKFVSIKDIDILAGATPIRAGEEHSFRISATNMNRCELNLLMLIYEAQDPTGSIIADTMALGFQKALKHCVPQIVVVYQENGLYDGYLAEGMSRAFAEYLRYILTYFQVSPSRLNAVAQNLLFRFIEPGWLSDEYFSYQGTGRDAEIVSAIFKSLSVFSDYMYNILDGNKANSFRVKPVPEYSPFIFVPIYDGFSITFPSSCHRC